MAVDSFKWLPPSLKVYFQNMQVETPASVPWTPLAKPLAEARVALVTTAGINLRGIEPPFDYEREQREPNWGDPTFRRIPRDVRQEQIQTGHLHINNQDIDRDFNVAIPISRMLELSQLACNGKMIERLAILHVNDPAGAQSLQDKLCDVLSCPERIIVAEFTPGLSVHAGTGVVGVSILTG